MNHYAFSPSDSNTTRHFSLAKELIACGHDVLILSSSFLHYTERQRSTVQQVWSRERVDGVPFVWVKSPPYRGNSPRRVWNMVVFAARCLRAPESVTGPLPDVILGSSPHLFAAFAAMRLAHRLKIPFVLEVRDLWPDTLVALGNFGRNHVFVRLLEIMERRLYKRADLILTVLPAASDRLTAKGADANRIRWLPNGVDFAMVPEVAAPPQGEKIVGMYAGAHGKANMLDGVLDAALVLQEKGWAEKLEIRLVGEGPEKRRLMVRAEVEGIRMIKFLDAVPKFDVYRILKEADFFLLLLKDSSLWQWGISPNKLFDYMAMARPLILSVQTPMNPVSIANAGITVPPEDPRSLAGAVEDLATATADERWRMGLRGRRYVAEEHNLTALARKLESMLCEVLADSRA